MHRRAGAVPPCRGLVKKGDLPMKHIALFCLLCAACLPAAASAMTMEELLASPGRYRVLYADEAEAVYADMTTVRRASRSGGAAFSFTMYAAAYKYRPGLADYRHGTLTANIQRYDARLTADGETRTYRLDKKLTDVWDRDGRRIGGSAWCGPLSMADGAPLFRNLWLAAEAGRAGERPNR